MNVREHFPFHGRSPVQPWKIGHLSIKTYFQSKNQKPNCSTSFLICSQNARTTLSVNCTFVMHIRRQHQLFLLVFPSLPIMNFCFNSFDITHLCHFLKMRGSAALPRIPPIVQELPRGTQEMGHSSAILHKFNSLHIYIYQYKRS